MLIYTFAGQDYLVLEEPRQYFSVLFRTGYLVDGLRIDLNNEAIRSL